MKAMIFYILPVLTLASLSGATLEVRTGLLHRLVQYYKHSFLHDLVDKAPVKVDVSIQSAPPGYKDSQAWDYDAVLRLLEVMRASDSAPARRLHDELELLQDEDVPSRRYMGMGRLHKARQRIKRRMQRCAGDPSRPGYPKYCPKRKHIPKYNRKIKKARGARKFHSRKDSLDRLRVPSIYLPNDLYYDDMLSLEELEEHERQPGDFDYDPERNNTINDDEILVITNPVEAKLPSGHISIGMLRRILEARAEAARVMPTRPPPTTSNTTEEDASSTTGGNATATGDTVLDDNTTEAAGNTTGGGDETTGTTGAGDEKEEGKDDGKKEGDEEKKEDEGDKEEGDEKPDEEKPAEDEDKPDGRLRSGKRKGPKRIKGRKGPKGNKGRKGAKSPKGRKGRKG